MMALVAGMMLLCAPVDRDDLWPLLRLGDEVWHRDVSSFTRPWFEWECPLEKSLRSSWVAGVIFHLLYQSKGTAAVGLFQALAVLAAFGVQGWLIRRRHGGSYVPCFAPLAALALGFSPHSHGAEVFSFLGLAALYLVLFRPKASLCGWILFVPLLFLPWANAHPGFVLGILFLAIDLGLCLREEFGRPSNASEERPASPVRTLVFLFSASLVVSFLTPFPLVRWTAPFRIGLSPFFHQDGTSALAPRSQRRNVVRTGLAVAGMFAGRKRLEAREVVRFVVFGLLAIVWARDGLLLALVAVPVIGAGLVSLREFANSRLSKPGRLVEFVLSQMVGFHLLACLGLLLAVCLVPQAIRLPALSVADWRFPGLVAKTIRESPVRGTVFNSPELGCYLAGNLLPVQKAVLTTFNSVEDPTRFSECLETIEKSENWEKVLKDYDTAALTFPESEWNIERRPSTNLDHLARALLASPEWKVVAWDDVAVLFLRDRPAYREFIAERELKMTNPVDLVLTSESPTPEDYEKAADEIEDQVRDRHPSCARALYAIGKFRLRVAQMRLEAIARQWEETFRNEERAAQKHFRNMRAMSGSPENEDKTKTQATGTLSPFDLSISPALRESRENAQRLRQEARDRLTKLTQEVSDQRSGVMQELYRSVSDILFELPALAPEIPESHYLRALGLMELDPWRMHGQILEALARAIELDPSYLGPRIRLAAMAAHSDSRNDLVAARDHLRFVSLRTPENRSVALQLAQLEMKLGNWAEAAKILELLRSKNGESAPDRTRVLFGLASACELLSRYSEAADCVAELHQQTVTPETPEGDFFLPAYLDLLKELGPGNGNTGQESP